MGKQENPDVEFLKSYLRELQKGCILLQELGPQDLLPTDDLPETSAADERCARLADDLTHKHGFDFDGNLFRNLIPSHPDRDHVDFLLAQRDLRRQIETIPRMIAAIESLATPAMEPRVPARPDPNAAVHSDDFTDVWWYGEHHKFTKAQAACIEVLWRNWERGTPEIRGDHILEAVDASSDQTLPKVFRIRGKQHAAWGKMIVAAKTLKGAYLLQPPIDAK